LAANDDDACMGAPSMLCFPHVAYNMVATTCRLGDIYDTLDPKTNEWLHKARRLLYVTLEQ
jgi:predicted glycosyltransferase